MGWRAMLWKIYSSVVASTLLFCVLWLLWTPTTYALSPKQMAATDSYTTHAVLADTPTPDPTVTALTKEQLQQQVEQLQFQNDHTLSTWFWGSSGTIITALVTLLAAYLAFLQWQRGQKLAQDKDREDQKMAQDKDLQDRRAERAKEAEDRFQKIVEGLGSDKDAVRIGAAVMLQRFVQPVYEDINAEDTNPTHDHQPAPRPQNDDSIQQSIQRVLHSLLFISEKQQPVEPSQDNQAEQSESAVFHRQAFDLAVAYLRTLTPIEDLTQSPPSFNQALIAILRDVYPLLRRELQQKYNLKPDEYLKPEILFQMLDAGYVRLDLAYLYQRPLEQIWMPGASLRGTFLQEAILSGANMKKANLSQANLSEADLRDVDLSEADLTNANLTGADLTGAILTGAMLKKAINKQATFNEVSLESAGTSQTDAGVDLTDANFTDANLTGANFTGADLTNADFTNADLTMANLSLTHPEKARSLQDTIMTDVTGLTDSQYEMCKKMGAIFEEKTKIAAVTP
jgi:uncharacterized protein YjbI with pentapeptide repeats